MPDPAPILTTADGSRTALNARYGEAYGSRHGARAQAWHVFVEGSGAATHPAPRVLEIGFGVGVNARATLAATAISAAPLHYLAYEFAPVSAGTLREVAVGGDAETHPAWAALCRAWDESAGRTGRNTGAGLDVRAAGARLEVRFGDVTAQALPQDWATALYLDGFSPARNPEVWTPEFVGRLAGALAPGGVLCTYSAAGHVRRSLQAAGLTVERRPGAPGKRECLRAARPALSAPGSAAPHVAVIGGGVAGASVAYALGTAGARVTLVDAGQHAASRVPSALLNPVRGQSGRVDPQVIAGLRRTWAWVDALEAAGFAVPHGRSGVLRPVPDDRTCEKFRRHLPAELPHAWLAPGDAPAPLSPGWAHALWLPEGGWLDGAAFTAALRRASGARVRRARAASWTARQVTLEGGETLEADAVVWCGGAVGSAWAGEAATCRAGSLLLLDRAPSSVPLSFGAYVAPAARGGVLGATFEAPAQEWTPPRLPLGSLDWLLGKGLALTPALRGAQITGSWSGTRLSELRCGLGADGVWRLVGLGSKGFLLGPLLASEVASGLAAQLGPRRAAGPLRGG